MRHLSVLLATAAFIATAPMGMAFANEHPETPAVHHEEAAPTVEGHAATPKPEVEATHDEVTHEEATHEEEAAEEHTEEAHPAAEHKE